MGLGQCGTKDILFKSMSQLMPNRESKIKYFFKNFVAKSQSLEKSAFARTNLAHSNSNQLMYTHTTHWMCVVCFSTSSSSSFMIIISYSHSLHTRIEIVFNRTETEIDVAYTHIQYIYSKRDNTSDIHIFTCM